MFYTRTFKVVLLIAILSAVVFYGIRNQWFGSGGIRGGPWHAVPENACLVVEAGNWSALEAKTGTLPYAGALDEALMTPVLQSIFAELAALCGDKYDLTALPFLASHHLARVGEPDLLLLMEHSGVARACKRGLKKITAGGLANMYEYKRREIFVMTDSLGRKLTVTILNNLVLASYTPFLVEDALAQMLVGSNLIADAHDMLMQQVKSSGQLRLLFYYPNMPLWLGGFMPAAMVKQRESWGDFATASYFDLTLKSGMILAEGATLAAESDALPNMRELPPMPAIPATAIGAKPFQFSPAPANRLERLFSRWLTGTGWIVRQGSLLGGRPGEILWLASEDNAGRLDTLLSYVSTPVKEVHGGQMLKVPTSWQQRVLGKYFYRADSTWLWVGPEGHLMFSDNETSLLSWLWASEEGQLVENDFQKGQAAFSYWHRTLMQSGPAPADTFNNRYASLQRMMEDMSISVKRQGEVWKTAIRVTMGVEAPAALLPFWVNETASPVVRGPFAIIGGNGQLLVVAQDSLQQLYAWNADGRLLWQRALDGLIAGEVFGVDLHRNNQLQLMFVTPKTVYCFNDKGSPAGGYPLKLAGTAAHLSLTGTDNRSRYYVTAVNGDVYGFEMNGRPIQGFSPLRANARGPVLLHPLTRQLIAVTGDNTVRAWSADSKPAWSHKLPAALMGSPALVVTDTLGMAWQALLAGGLLAEVAESGTFYTREILPRTARQAGLGDSLKGWVYEAGMLGWYWQGGEQPLWQYALGDSPDRLQTVAVMDSLVGVVTGTGVHWLSLKDGKALVAKVPGNDPAIFDISRKPGWYGAVVSPDSKRVAFWLLRKQ